MKTNIKQTAEWLNERWSIAMSFGRLEDELFYRGAFEAIEHMGYYVARKPDGTHIITKR